MSYRCPTCEKIIFNRRLERCEFCAGIIPPEMRFSAEEIAKLDESVARSAETAKRRAAEREKEEKLAERLRAKQGSKGILPSPADIVDMISEWKSNKSP
jgi:hypothetical protein